MAMDTFAPYSTNPYCFVVQNIGTKPKKTIKIFNEPIPYNQTADLMAIEGIGETDIRNSLAKGELRNKLIAGEITVLCSDIDLLQFNAQGLAFLTAAGITVGTQVSGGDGYGITEAQHQTLLQLIHFIDQGPATGFASGAVRVTTGEPFPTNICWYYDSSLTKKLVEKQIAYNANKTPNVETWIMYDSTGMIALHTVTDTFTYVNNVFESTRTRTISA